MWGRGLATVKLLNSIYILGRRNLNFHGIFKKGPGNILTISALELTLGSWSPVKLNLTKARFTGCYIYILIMRRASHILPSHSFDLKLLVSIQDSPCWVHQPRRLLCKVTMHVSYIGWGFQAKCTPFKVLISSCEPGSQRKQRNMCLLSMTYLLCQVFPHNSMLLPPYPHLTMFWRCMMWQLQFKENFYSVPVALISMVFHICSVMHRYHYPHFYIMKLSSRVRYHQDPKTCKRPWDYICLTQSSPA